MSSGGQALICGRSSMATDVSTTDFYLLIEKFKDLESKDKVDRASREE
jgi:hypothetical protein